MGYNLIVLLDLKTVSSISQTDCSAEFSMLPFSEAQNMI